MTREPQQRENLHAQIQVHVSGEGGGGKVNGGSRNKQH